MLVTRLGFIATLLLSLGANALGIVDEEVNKTSAEMSSTVAPTPSPTKNKVKRMAHADIHPELRAQMATKKVPKRSFWVAVAQCETGQDWDHGGEYAGGMGIATVTWVGYGGRQFAKTAKTATKDEQMIVANRIAFLGFQTADEFLTLDDKLNNRPYFRPPSWTPKWGIRCVNWRKAKAYKVYPEKR